MAILDYTLVAAATTGNNVHAGVHIGSPEKLAVDFLVEAVGATPTVTFSVQGSIDGTNWFALALVASNSDTVVNGGAAVTAAGHNLYFLDTFGESRFFKWLRVVTTLNTNVTYSVKAWTTED